MKRLIALAGFLVCADVQAQTMSDLPSTETQSSSQGLPTTQTQAQPPATGGGPRAYYPGMPLPKPEQQGEGAAKPGKEPERQGLILTDDSFSSDDEGGGLSVAPGGPPVEVPDTHTVQKGDTLWDLSARYYRNAWGWPKMWSYNPQITNPHWIYPGDVIRVAPPGGAPTPTQRQRKRRRCRRRASSGAARARRASSCARPASSSRASSRRRARSSAAKKRS